MGKTFSKPAMKRSEVRALISALDTIATTAEEVQGYATALQNSMGLAEAIKHKQLLQDAAAQMVALREKLAFLTMRNHERRTDNTFTTRRYDQAVRAAALRLKNFKMTRRRFT